MPFAWMEKAAKRIAVVSATLALFCVPVPGVRAQPLTTLPQGQPEQISPDSANFAVADFDGDRQPDLATVEMERSASSGDSRYSIRFKLTSGNSQIFGVTAPVGGLRLTARDVNGDQALDLLVSSAWQFRQVAVFLNDGHGNFTPAGPEAFPGSLSEFVDGWFSEPSASGGDAALLPIRTHTQGEPSCSARSRAAEQAGMVEPGVFRARCSLFLLSWSGRAPPATVLQA